MKETQSKSAIRNSFIALFAVFAFTIILNYLLSSYYLKKVEGGQLTINLAGKNRSIVQKIALDADKILNGNENLQIGLRDLILEHSITLQTLKTGGKVRSGTQEVTVSSSPDAPTIEAIKRTEELWKKYSANADIIAKQPLYIVQQEEKKAVSLDVDIEIIKANSIKRILNPEIQKAAEFIKDKVSDMVIYNDQVVTSYLAMLDNSRKQSELVLLILTIFNISFLIIAFVVMRKNILLPIAEIARTAQRITQGDFSTKIAENQDNEIGIVSNAINKMMTSLESATSFIKNIGEGNLDTKYEGLDGMTQDSAEQESLASSLLLMRQQMRNVAEEEEERKWVTEGLALFVDVLRDNSTNTSSLAYGVAANLVKYVDANQGAIYLTNEENGQVINAELAACYAYGKQKFLKQTIQKGDGLIGQILQEGDKIYINDIPEDYADISSGLGGAHPRSVLVIPMKLNDKLLGMIELASFKEFRPYQIEFIERLAGNIASTLSSVKVNETTNKLLAESRLITEQMQTQEELMRQNYEQLQVTQQEMLKNEAVLTAQSYAISTTLISAEYDMSGKLIKANEQFMDKFKYDMIEIRTKQHRNFLNTTDVSSVAYQLFWEKLQSGRTQTDEYKRIAKDGTEIWLRATYVPIPDKKGSFYKVICLAFDITQEKQTVIDFKAQVESIRRSSVTLEFDLQGFVTDANDIFLEISKLDKTAILGKHYNVLVGKERQEDDEEFKQLWRKLKGGSYEMGEYMMLDADRDEIWLQGSFNPIFDLNGNTFKIVMFASDITSRKQGEKLILDAQRKARMQQENLTALINNTDERIFSIDKNHFVNILNNNAMQVFRQMGREIEIGMNILDTFPPAKYDELKKPYDRALTGEKVREEERYINNKGEDLLLLVTYNPIFDEEDNVQGVTVFAKDITEIKRNEERLRKTQKEMEETEFELRVLLNSTKDALFSVNHQFRLITFNTPFKEYIKRTYNQDVKDGDSIEKFLEDNKYLDLCKKALIGESSRENINRKSITSSPILSKTNQILGVVMHILL